MRRAAAVVLGAGVLAATFTTPSTAQQFTPTTISWGSNSSGELGDGTTTDRSTPVEVHLPAGTQVTAIAGGGFHSLAVTSDGRVLAWGGNNTGQLGDGTTDDRSTPAEVDLPAGAQATAVAAGGNHSLALTSDGRVFAWGRNYYGQLGDGTTDDRSTPAEVHLPAGTQATAIAAGDYNSLALTSDGRVLAWGRNYYGQLGDGTTTDRSTPVEVHLPAGTQATAIAAGRFHGLAVTSDDRVLAWGSNSSGQLGDGTTTAYRSTPAEVHLPVGTQATAIAGGGFHSLAVTSDGRVLAWGENNYGQVGDGTTDNRSTPAEVDLPAGTQVTAIAGGQWGSLALTSDGRVLAWGENNYGQVGDGTTVSRSTPVEVHLPVGTQATAIAAAYEHRLALTVRASSTSTLTATSTEASPGEPVTLTATVNCPGTATGDVTFTQDGAALGAATLQQGTATLTVHLTEVGEHHITADYGGSEQCAPSTSNTVTITIVPTVTPRPGPPTPPGPPIPPRPASVPRPPIVRVTG